MLIRSAFVTNSSTSSYLVYGVYFNNQEKIRKAIYELVGPDAIAEKINNYGDFLPEDFIVGMSAFPYEMFSECLDEIDSYERDELFNEILQSKHLEIRSDGEDDDIYLRIDKSLKTVIEDGKVVFVDITADDVMGLQKIAEAAGAKNPMPQLHHWARSDY